MALPQQGVKDDAADTGRGRRKQRFSEPLSALGGRKLDAQQRGQGPREGPRSVPSSVKLPVALLRVADDEGGIQRLQRRRLVDAGRVGAALPNRKRSAKGRYRSKSCRAGMVLSSPGR